LTHRLTNYIAPISGRNIKVLSYYRAGANTTH